MLSSGGRGSSIGLPLVPGHSSTVQEAQAELFVVPAVGREPFECHAWREVDTGKRALPELLDYQASQDWEGLGPPW